MNWCRHAGIVCQQNFRKWATDYRVWIVGIFALLLTRIFTQGIAEFSSLAHLPVSPWIYPFLSTHNYVKLLFFFPLVLLFCNAPFIDDNQPYVFVRSGRSAWCAGQVLYIILATGAYFAVLILCTFLLHFPHMAYDADWGKVIGTLAATNAYQQLNHPVFVSSHIVTYFTPPVAMWYTFLLSWLAGVFLGLVIYCINSLSRTRSLGVFAAAFFLIWDAVCRTNYKLIRFSPVSWCNLDTIDIGGVTSYPSIQFILTGYAVLLAALIALTFFITRRQTIDVMPQI